MGITNLIWFIIVGVVAGFLAGKIIKGKGFGFLGNLAVGIVGGVLGGWAFGLLGVSFHGLLGSILCATGGAVLLLALVQALKK